MVGTVSVGVGSGGLVLEVDVFVPEGHRRVIITTILIPSPSSYLKKRKVITDRRKLTQNVGQN
jgi:hypothetical protein